MQLIETKYAYFEMYLNRARNWEIFCTQSRKELKDKEILWSRIPARFSSKLMCLISNWICKKFVGCKICKLTFGFAKSSISRARASSDKKEEEEEVGKEHYHCHFRFFLRFRSISGFSKLKQKRSQESWANVQDWNLVFLSTLSEISQREEEGGDF